MAGDTTIRAIIKLLVEGGHVPKEVAESIKGVGTQAKGAQKELGVLGKTGQDVGSLLKKFLGAAALGSFIKSSVSEFAALDRQFSALGFSMNKLGIGGPEDLGKIRASLEALASSGGAIQAQTVPAMQKFVGITRDVPKALAAIKLASDVSESGIVDFGTAAQGVAAVLQGRAKQAAQTFGIELFKVNGQAKNNQELMKEIIKTYSGVGDAFDDASNALDQANAGWEKAKLIVGKGLAPALKLLPDILGFTIGLFKDLGDVGGLVANSLIAVFRGTARGLAATFDFKTLFSDPGKYIENVKAVQKQNVGEMGDAWKVFTEGIAANHAKAAGAVTDDTKGLAALTAQAARATAEADGKEAESAAQKRLDVEHKLAQDLLQAKIQAAGEGSSERLRFELDLLADQEKAAVESAKRVGASVAAVHEAFDLQRAAKEKEYAQARAAADYDAETQNLRARADLLEEGTQARLDADLAMLERERDHQLEVFAGTIEGKRAIEAAYQVTRLAVLMEYDQQAADSALEVYRSRLEAEHELDVANAEARLEGAATGETGEDPYQVQRDQAQAEYDFEIGLLAAKHDQEILAADATGAAIDDIVKKYDAKELAAALKLKRALHKIDADQVLSKQQAGMAIAQAAVGLAQAVFGHNKAVAIASTIINTAQAIMNALTVQPYPVGIALAVVAAATGIAQIAKIRSTSIGDGGTTNAAEGAIIGEPMTAGGPKSAPGTVRAMLTPGELVVEPRAAAKVLSGDAVLGGHGSAPPIPLGSATETVPNAPAGDLPPGFSVRGTDTVPAEVKSGSIVLPVDVSDQVRAGTATVEDAATAPPGSRRIIGGKLAVTSIEAADEPAGVPPVHAADGAVIQGGVARLAASFSGGVEARAKAPRIIGGASFSRAALPQVGAAFAGGVRSANDTTQSAAIARTVDTLKGTVETLAVAVNELRDARPNDQSTHVHGNLYGGDAGMRQLSRELERAKRLDENRVIR